MYAYTGPYNDSVLLAKIIAAPAGLVGVFN